MSSRPRVEPVKMILFISLGGTEIAVRYCKAPKKLCRAFRPSPFARIPLSRDHVASEDLPRTQENTHLELSTVGFPMLELLPLATPSFKRHRLKRRVGSQFHPTYFRIRTLMRSLRCKLGMHRMTSHDTIQV